MTQSEFYDLKKNVLRLFIESSIIRRNHVVLWNLRKDFNLVYSSTNRIMCLQTSFQPLYLGELNVL